MPNSLSGDDPRDGRPEPRARRLSRRAVVVWLLVIQPVALALTFEQALPRAAAVGAAGWLVLAMHLGLAGAGIAVAQRLRAHEPDAWRGVVLWAGAAIGATLVERAWPVLPTTLAPSEARLAAVAAVVRDAALAVVAARLARAGTTVTRDGATPRDSS